MVADVKGNLTYKTRDILTRQLHTQVQSNYNKKLEILDLNAECEVAKTVSRVKLFHNGMTLGKKEAE